MINVLKGHGYAQPARQADAHDHDDGHQIRYHRDHTQANAAQEHHHDHGDDHKRDTKTRQQISDHLTNG